MGVLQTDVELMESTPHPCWVYVTPLQSATNLNAVLCLFAVAQMHCGSGNKCIQLSHGTIKTSRGMHCKFGVIWDPLFCLLFSSIRQTPALNFEKTVWIICRLMVWCYASNHELLSSLLFLLRSWHRCRTFNTVTHIKDIIKEVAEKAIHSFMH